MRYLLDIPVAWSHVPLLPLSGKLWIHDKVEKVRVSRVFNVKKIKSVPGIRFTTLTLSTILLLDPNRKPHPFTPPQCCRQGKSPPYVEFVFPTRT
jgi:hypothetical protein